VSTTDWNRIFQEEFIARERCWETCGGGYCCKPHRVQRNFSFLRSQGVELPLLPGVYHYLTARRRLQRGFEETMTSHRITLPNGIHFPIYRTVCNLDGLCSDHAHRPLICRLYPWVPVPNLDGSLDRVEPAALIDLYWDELQGAHNPCSIGLLTRSEEDSYRHLAAELFRDPQNIFYMKAASLYKAAIKTGMLEGYPHLLAGSTENFFSAWEKLLVLGKLYKPQDILVALAELYDALKDQWGDTFSLCQPEHPDGNDG